ncbi:MAG: hypothetical protein MUP16_12810 [Sedimentisphaerales bacterium]|nr:hypothetical protein [Sedimentisphaerales bacterium]
MAKKEKETGDRIKVTHEPHPLACKLTTSDRALAAGQLAEAIQNLESLEVVHKTDTKNYNSLKQQLTGSIHRLSREVMNGEAVRSVDCELRLNYVTLTAELWRTDTGEMTDTRPMTEDEEQMDMEF